MIENQKRTQFAVAAAGLFSALALLAAAGAPAMAQEADTLEEETYVAATHGDWTVRCAGSAPDASSSSDDDDDGKGDLQDDEETETDASAALDPPQCVMVQIARHTESEDIGISIIVVRQRVSDQMVSQMRITTPISVFLPAMVGLEIDGAAIGRLPYEVCSPAGVCVATTFIDEDLEAQFKRGGEAQFFLKDVRGTDGIFVLSLSGFTAAFDGLHVPGS